ncbi:MAG: ABC transporter permease, partial [Lachnospiraceae bacterium]|nr:ABC transporter permease [Lachnospiraceae bacterium]
MLWKTTFREIKHTLGRYLAILAIVALGVGFYAGLKLTRPVMVATVQDFVEKQNFYDYRLISTLGFEKEDVEAFLKLPDVCRAVGAVSVDVLYEAGENESVIRLHTITEGINDCYLVAGRMPKEPGECLVDSRLMTEADMGNEIVIAGDNDEDTLD